MYFPSASRGGPFWRRREKPRVHAVDGVSLVVNAGETVGLIGESGSGKSTLGRTILRLYEPTAGKIYFEGEDLSAIHGEQLRRRRRRMQMIFQNPYSAVNRRMTLLQTVTEPMRAHSVGTEESRTARGLELLNMVGLPSVFARRYPHQVSGGQLQRVGIARALSTEPRFLVVDEPTASLDVSVRAQVINVLADLQRELQLTMLLISHDLSILSYLCERIAVMYLGKVVEEGPAADIERRPMHPYTRALIAAIPRMAPRGSPGNKVPMGETPSVMNRPTGCHYHPRCQYAMPICKQEYPVLEKQADGGSVACHAVNAGRLPWVERRS